MLACVSHAPSNAHLFIPVQAAGLGTRKHPGTGRWRRTDRFICTRPSATPPDPWRASHPLAQTMDTLCVL